MYKNVLTGDQPAFVEDAKEWAKRLVQSESRGPGDTDNAMRRIEARYGISYATLWRLRYRQPTDLLVSVYARIEAAYITECERQQRLFEHERAITQAKSRLGKNLVSAASSLVGEED